jgi:hypothetical protein
MTTNSQNQTYSVNHLHIYSKNLVVSTRNVLRMLSIRSTIQSNTAAGVPQSVQRQVYGLDRLWGPPSLRFNGYRGSFPEVGRSKRGVNRPLASTAQLQNEWSYTSTPSICLHGLDKEKFTFSLKLNTTIICDLLRARIPEYVGPCHHGMARPQVADGGDDLQISTVAAYWIIRRAATDTGWSSNVGIGRGSSNSSP